jgi:hypothetical protein
MKRLMDTMNLETKVYRDRFRELCQIEPIAARLYDMSRAIGLSEEDTVVRIAVHALECLKATQQELLEAKLEAPPDAIIVRNEDGSRCLIRYIGPTIQELRKERNEA